LKGHLEKGILSGSVKHYFGGVEREGEEKGKRGEGEERRRGREEKGKIEGFITP
jgi:hypothetical protein